MLFDFLRCSPPPPPSPEGKDPLIEHLSSEIESLVESTMNFRARISFSLMVGPALFFSSIIITGKKIPVFTASNDLIFIPLGWLILAFLTLGYLAGKIEMQAWAKINEWRKCVARIYKSQDQSFEEINKLLQDDQIVEKVAPLYFFAFVLMLIVFSMFGWILLM